MLLHSDKYEWRPDYAGGWISRRNQAENHRDVLVAASAPGIVL